MKVTFDTQNEVEVKEVATLLGLLGEVPVETKTEVAVKQTETAVEDTKEAEPIPKPTQVKKRAPRAKKEEVKVTLADLKELAKNKSTSAGREAVKEVISNYGGKLADVKTTDYQALSEDLGKL